MPLLTLEAMRKHGLFQAQDRSALLMSEVMKGLREYKASLKSSGGSYNTQLVSPESQAVSFYVLNDMAARASGLPPELEDLLARAYFECVAGQTVRMVAYLILICSRESRHVKNKSTVMLKYHPVIKGHHSKFHGSEQTMEYMLEDLEWEGLTFGEYAHFLEDVFFEGGFSGGFGGTKWGYIGRLLNQYVTGKLSGELMLDQAYTLCHNNGPIFNKGMLYEMYSSKFTSLLDKQHAGTLFSEIQVGPPQTYWLKSGNYSRYPREELREKIAPYMGGGSSKSEPSSVAETTGLPSEWLAALSEELPKPLEPLNLGPLVGEVPQFKKEREE